MPRNTHYQYYKIPSENVNLITWWSQYALHHRDYLRKASEVVLFPYILENAPHRWYSRSVINLYAPIERGSPKLFFRVSLDIESIIIGTAFGLFLVFRHFLDYNLTKSPAFRPGESVCTGRNTHLYLKWKNTHINPRKYFDHDRKIFYRKLVSGFPHALLLASVGAFFTHVFFSQTFGCVDRHFPLFIAEVMMIHEVYLKTKTFANLDIHYNIYQHPELYGLAMIMLYSTWRWFRNYSANIPLKRVLIG